MGEVCHVYKALELSMDGARLGEKFTFVRRGRCLPNSPCPYTS